LKRDIYIAIMIAAHKGVGIRLSAEEVGQLSIDEAIHMAALNGCDHRDWPNWQTFGEPDWETLDPYRKRNAQDLATRAPEDERQGPRQHGWPVGTHICDCVTGEVEPQPCRCADATLTPAERA
jgi:hypothetical protein